MTLAVQMRALRAAVDADRVRVLARPQPRRVCFALTRDWLCIAAAVIAVALFAEPSKVPWLSGAQWLRWPLAFVTIGVCQYRLFVLGHDGLHGCLHGDRKANDRIARWLIYGPLLTGFDDSRRHHAIHHEALGTVDDPERYLYGLESKNSRWKLVLLCSGLLTFLNTVERVLPYRAVLRRLRGQRAPESRRPEAGLLGLLAQRLPVLLAQLLIVAAFLALGLPWWSYLALWLAPIYVLVFLPDELRSFCDHAVLRVPDAAADAERLVSYQPGVGERLLFAPYNLNLQAEHHLFPELPFASLPELQCMLATRAEIDRRGGYLSFLWRAFCDVPVTERSDDG